MANVIIPPERKIPERNATPQDLYLNRRAFMKRAVLGAAAANLRLCDFG
jgi:hypothetical protein